MFYQAFIKPFLFSKSPEDAHHYTMGMWRKVMKVPVLNTLLANYYTVKDKRLERQFAGLTFPNPVGLAAGFDKDGKYMDVLPQMGFGFVEIGTVTPRPQVGNPQPRLFRLPEDEAVINRMGFNNEGVDALVARLKKGRPEGVILGGNIGKNKTTPNEDAEQDYFICFEALFEYVDYFVVNVSSPNTPNLRALQDKEPLTKLLAGLQERNYAKSSPKPILLKIAPDLTDTQIDEIIEIVQETQIAGLIATNTTIDRSGLQTPTSTVEEIGNGGLSGKPLRERSTEVVRYIREKAGPDLFLIGVGGIDSPDAAIEKINAGADLVQVYSGMIYAGPSLMKNINLSLLKQ